MQIISSILFCAASNTNISVSPGLMGLKADPETPQGTLVFSYNMYLNISEGTNILQLDGDDTFSLHAYSGEVFHFSEGDLSSTELYYYYHYYQTQFSIKLPGMEASTFINLTGPIQEKFPLSNALIEECSWGNSAYIKVPVEVFLDSPYLYHLGNIYVYIDGYIRENTQNYYQEHYFYNELYISTTAGRELCHLCHGLIWYRVPLHTVIGMHVLCMKTQLAVKVPYQCCLLSVLSKLFDKDKNL